ncbi:hypothetical protein COCC4DRAFT_68523, partial [Bipolaris maydis ATCC 48331]
MLPSALRNCATISHRLSHRVQKRTEMAINGSYASTLIWRSNRACRATGGWIPHAETVIWLSER